MTLPVLNIVGTGKLGTVFGRLLADSGQVRIGALFSRTIARTQAARQLIGQGATVAELHLAPPAEFWLIATSDDGIADIARQLATLERHWPGAAVFHCSGIHSSRLLAPLAERGAAVASLHPAHSFANPQTSLTTFAGTCCAVEGDELAATRLTTLFEAIGANVIPIATPMKALYHAATAVASNHLVALLDSALTMLRTAGIDDATARALLAPLAANSCANVFALGPQQALTGPIARGDSGTIALHLDAIAASRPELLAGYRELAKLTLAIASRDRDLPGHTAIAALLSGEP